MNILMPQLGETVAEGTITSWYKSVGDSVAAGENLFELETDKASMEVPSIVTGVVTEIRASAGSIVPVGAIVAVIAEGAAQSGSATNPVAAIGDSRMQLEPGGSFSSVRTPPRNFGSVTRGGGTQVTPIARRLATEYAVDLATVTGSGPNGRIVAKDVERAGRDQQAGALTATQAVVADASVEVIPLDGMRRAIAKRLAESKQTIPHFYASVDVEMDQVAKVRAEFVHAAGAGNTLSINDFVIKALGLALQQVPHANAAWAQDKILRFKCSDIGVAVAVDGGVFTPVIRRVESKSIRTISDEMRSLATRARSRALQPTEYQGGSISISNLGMYGVKSFSAIINPPQSAMLAVGAVRRQPFEADGGGVRFGSVMTVTLSSDHRVIDGALGAQLLAAFKGLLETPRLLLE